MMPPDGRITVVGLGVVGIPVAVELARAGFDVIGLDVAEERAEAVRDGRYPLAGDEPGLPERLAEAVASGKLTATTDPTAAFAHADVVIICVQTPFDVERIEPRYGSLKAALSSVSAHLRSGMLVIVESTLAPTTMDRVVAPALEKESGLAAGTDFDLVHCPERVMPGKLIHNLTQLPRVVGGNTPEAAARAAAIYRTFVNAELDTTSMLAAEVVKTAENTYRDVQIAFANELALICEDLGLDAFEIRDLVNKSPFRHVHEPGAGVGGHCIPKDTWLLAYGTKGIRNPDLMITARRVNDGMPDHFAAVTANAIGRAGIEMARARVLLLGASYLPNTGDTRETPTVPLARALSLLGADVTVHDPFVTGTVGDHFAVTNDPVTELAAGMDAIVLVTAHDAYRTLDLDALAKGMRTRVLADGRNVWQRAAAEASGFLYTGIGKGSPATRAGPKPDPAATEPEADAS